MFFELIRIAIGKQGCLSRTPSPEDWQRLYTMAERHALLGICFVGVKKLDRQEQKPPMELYYQWLGVAAQIQQRNEVMNKHCVSAGFRFQDAGFKWCVLKGQGIAQLYGSEISQFRQSGDIDIWVDGGMKRALAWARENYGDVAYDYINAHLPMFKETEVELHWRVRSMSNLMLNGRLQKWIDEHQEELFNTTIGFPNGIGAIHVPSEAFNRWYILLHCYNHIFSEGLGLRQIMDLYFVLVSSSSGDKWQEEKDYSEFFLDALGLRKFAGAIMWLLGFVFGLEREKMLCKPDEKEGRYILNEVIQNGNMGHHDERIKRVSRNARVQSIASTLQHNWHLATHYPSEFFWSPIWIVWHFCWKRM